MTRTKIISAFPRDPDGEGFFGVIAENKRGNRWALAGYFHRDEARVAKLAADVQAFGSINLDHWVETYPCYGSQACEDEQAEASHYAQALSSGMIREDDVPEAFRTLL